MTELHPSSFSRFVRAVAVLALPVDGQLAYLDAVGVPAEVDELGLEFDDGWLLCRQFVEFGWLPPEALRQVERLEDSLTQMSGEVNGELWTAEALRSAEEWQHVRQLARELLFSL